MSDFEFGLLLRARLYTSIALCWISLRFLAFANALAQLGMRIEGEDPDSLKWD